MSLDIRKKIQEIRGKANDSQEVLAAKLSISRQLKSKTDSVTFKSVLYNNSILRDLRKSTQVANQWLATTEKLYSLYN